MHDLLWQWGVTHSLITHISPHFFVLSKRQGGAPGRRCWRSGRAWEGQRAGGRRLGARQRLMHTWGPSLESLPLAGPCVPKARGRGSLSLCLFPFNNTSVCNLRQVGEEKKKRKGKKKENGKNSAVIPASASSSLSSPASQEPRHRHPALARGCSGGSAWGSPGDKPQLLAWSRERKALGLGREKTHLGGKVSKRDVQLECLAGEKCLQRAVRGA